MGLKFKRYLLAATLAISVGSDSLSVAADLPTPKPTETPAPETASVKKAFELEKAKDWNGMIKLLEPETESLSRRGALLLAEAYGAKGEHWKQINLLEIAKTKTENDYFMASVLGEAYLLKAKKSSDTVAKRRDYEASANSFRSAIESHPDYHPAYDGLLRALDLMDDRFEARSLVTDMTKRFGDKPAYAAALCRLYSIDGFIAKAVETCARAIELDSRLPDNHVYLGLSTRDKENEAQAEKILNKAAQEFPASEFAQWAAGQLAFDRKSYLASERYFLQGAKADPLSVRNWLGAGKAAMEAGRIDAALTGFTKACELDRQTLADMRKAAGVLRQKKNAEQAEKFDAATAGCGSKDVRRVRPN